MWLCFGSNAVPHVPRTSCLWSTREDVAVSRLDKIPSVNLLADGGLLEVLDEVRHLVVIIIIVISSLATLVAVLLCDLLEGRKHRLVDLQGTDPSDFLARDLGHLAAAQGTQRHSHAPG